MGKKKAHLFIDGTNLYAAQYELFGPKKYLDFSIFIKEVEEELKVKFKKIFFYASYSPRAQKLTKKQKAYLRNEALFYKGVKQTKRVTLFKGYRSKISGKEKEVDVKLAVDIVDFAHQKRYKNLYLFSGDADFMQALKIAEELNREIEILALQNRIPLRFTFNYPTYIIIFPKRTIFIKTNNKQKIKIIRLKKETIKSV